MDTTDQPAQVHRVLDELDAGVSRRRIPGRVGNVVEREQDTGQQQEGDQDEDHPAEAVVEGVGEVGHALIERLIDRLGERIALIEPIHDRHLDVAWVRDCHQKPSTMPSTTIWSGVAPCFQVRCESGTGAGPCRTVPSMWNRDPWHGQSNVFSALLNATEQPRCEQLIAKTSTLPECLTTNPPKASSPGALSPPPSAMMNAVFGLRGASNLTTSLSCTWSMGVWSATLTGPFFWPFGGAGQK